MSVRRVAAKHFYTFHSLTILTNFRYTVHPLQTQVNGCDPAAATRQNPCELNCATEAVIHAGPRVPRCGIDGWGTPDVLHLSLTCSTDRLVGSRSCDLRPASSRGDRRRSTMHQAAALSRLAGKCDDSLKCRRSDKNCHHTRERPMSATRQTTSFSSFDPVTRLPCINQALIYRSSPCS